MPEVAVARAGGVIVAESVAAAVGEVIETVGGTASTPVTVKLAVAVLPAASCAVTVSTFVPSWMGIPLAVQLVVPVAMPLPTSACPRGPWRTPAAAAAVPPPARGELLGVWAGHEVGAGAAPAAGGGLEGAAP